MSVVGMLTVTLHSARGLRKTQLFGTDDPYVKVRLGKDKQKTPYHTDGGKEPRWEHGLLFAVGPKSEVTPDSCLHVKVCNECGPIDPTMGIREIPLTELTKSTEPQWYILAEPANSKIKAGEILISASFSGTGLPSPADTPVRVFGAETSPSASAPPLPSRANPSYTSPPSVPATHYYSAPAPVPFAQSPPSATDHHPPSAPAYTYPTAPLHVPTHNPHPSYAAVPAPSPAAYYAPAPQAQYPSAAPQRFVAPPPNPARWR